MPQHPIVLELMSGLEHVLGATGEAEVAKHLVHAIMIRNAVGDIGAREDFALLPVKITGIPVLTPANVALDIVIVADANQLEH